MLAKILNFFGALVFFLFAWLQQEDDNPEVYVEPSMADVILWIGFYGLVGVLFVLAACRKFPKFLYLFVLALGTFHLISTIPGIFENLRTGDLEMAKESMSAAKPEVELSREFFGVLIAFAATWGAWVQRPKAKNGIEEDTEAAALSSEGDDPTN